MSTCEECGRSYEAQRSTSRFCSGTCRKRAWEARTALPGGVHGDVYAATVAFLDRHGIDDPERAAVARLAAQMDDDQRPGDIAVIAGALHRAITTIDKRRRRRA